MNINRIVELLEDLKSDDVRKRLVAVKNLDKITDALGPEKTRTTFLPFLKEYEDDEEEVMVEIARQLLPLGKFIHDGGSGVLELLPYFYIFLSYEDNSVINQAFRSLEGLIKAFNINNESVLQLAKKLQGMNSSKAQVSASRICCLLPHAIPTKFSPDITRMISDCAGHKSCIVRKETAVALRNLLDEASPFESLASGLLKKFLKDSQESVRVAAAESIAHRRFPKPYFTATFLPSMMQLFELKSWKTKWVLAATIGNSLGSVQTTAKKPLLQAFAKLVGDPEIEVSTRAIESFKELAGILEPEDAVVLLNTAKPFLTHENLDIRKVIAKSAPHLAPLCTQGQANDLLKELVMTLLKDESAEVKSILMSNAEPLTRAFTSAQLSAIFSAHLLEHLADKNWKVRKDTLTCLEVLCSKLGEAFASEERIVKAIKERLSDRVFEVRTTMISVLRNLASSLGREWTDRICLPIFWSFVQNGNYLYRLSYVFGIKELQSVLSPPHLLKESETLLKLAKDPVANVRVQAIITLVRIARQLDEKTLDDKLLNAMKDLESDNDSDVQRVVTRNGATGIKQIAARLSELKIL